ncbi:MAG: hypothetical protein NC826_05250 [Candidatus Omnitrophica bacterium]|nr:hypothetical protein [Candidatus Omnitrophota bacterium]
MRKESESNSKFTCESCLKKVGMVIREYGTGKWLCYDCYFSKEIPKEIREIPLKGDNKNV